MRLQQVLDDILEILEAEEDGLHFATLGALRKSKFQNDKSEDELFLRHDMYAGTVGNKEAAKRGAETKKKRAKEVCEAEIEQARQKRSDWYNDPENHKKFMAALEKRKHNLEKKKGQSKKKAPIND